MPVPADLVYETSTTTGTGNFTVAAVNGYQRFSTAFGTGVTTNVFVYYISDTASSSWEMGTGHMSDANTLVRDTVILSTNANALVSFGAGTKNCTNDVPATNQITGSSPTLGGDLVLNGFGLDGGSTIPATFTFGNEGFGISIYGVADYEALRFDFDNSAVARTTFGYFETDVTDDTAGAEYGAIYISPITNGGTGFFLRMGDDATSFNMTDGSAVTVLPGGMDFYSPVTGDIGQSIQFDNASPFTGRLFNFITKANNSVGATYEYGGFGNWVANDTDGIEASYWSMGSSVAGAGVETFRAGSFGGASSIRFPLILAKPVLGTDANGDIIPPAVVALADGAASVIDASLGSVFTQVATADRTLGTPTNPTAGQKIVIEFTASGANRTLTLPTGANNFRFGTDITALTATTSALTDYITCVWNSGASRWDVVGVAKGY